MIPYGRQNINQADIDAVIEVLNSDFLTQGPKVPEFERAITQYTGAKHAVATNSATSALHLACLALGLSKGDWLWTSPITFVASANCGLYCNANIDFVDIDAKTYNMCPLALEAKLEEAEKLGRLPKIVIPVHLCGQSCDMEKISALAKQYGFKIIEDASHAIGGKYQGQAIGNSRYSDITVFSFHPVKIITTGEGGMAVTNKEYLAERMSLLRSHGITRNPDLMTQEPDGPWYYQQIALGFNYRITDIQAALGISQIARLDEFIEKRQLIAKQYDELLSNMPVTTPWHHPDSQSSFHLYPIRIKTNECTKSHREIFDVMRNNGIGVNLHYIPIYMQPAYAKFNISKDNFPQANNYYEQAISLPIFPELTQSNQQKVITTLMAAIAP
ncbi:UDP-4-amino-4,6-dideoxy-N-acetyl-beta-L-altrosamine transaminase [Zhongshania sp.]|uniref:UDP-4-amino-4, 6-dideoxy-N-acetyl-beta-L-altrosamine transaminase n=1 Tax=Zhongshania sp. TaxID=1971902 RepID=UPI001B75E6C8|nr:UDP-4-amino-4,6-dideoxy-N-acetyl-beta-L-altrosamine transaminase [Zhongshania sp.]MBQ0797313.1 UDP-4-amino-4,6-dideoxy-N-acetyl-beta-L-altrosamine transaminase [Zhongshania sp.]